MTEHVSVLDGAFKEICDRGQAYVGMRPDIQSLTGTVLHRSEVIKKDERAHHSCFGRRQSASDDEAFPQILCLRLNQMETARF
jgi:hypothetical protein